MTSKIRTLGYAPDTVKSAREQLSDLLHDTPIPENELLANLGLYMRPSALNRLLFMNEMYQHCVGIQGVIMEFGVRWGQNLALYQAFRAIYEPFNYQRKIIGFDTWEGFPSVHEKDGDSDIIEVGAYGVTAGYESHLQQVLDVRETESPNAHVSKHELRKGNAITEIETYLKENPQTIVAMAYFDFDIYEPTARCLEAIRPHLTKGSIIGFDELNLPDYPGETVAVREVFGLDKYTIRRSKHSLNECYIIIE